jgi:hypothetical protein
LAYKRESHHILAGSLSYLPPGDLVSEGDALQLTNFRPDQLGALRSRLGHTSLYTGLTGSIRSLIKALGHRYAGSTSLYTDGAGAVTGFSGEPMGLVDWKKWLWVMDQSKQGKHDGTNFRQWHITAPVAAPVVAPASEVAKTVTAFENSETWTVDPSGSDSFDGTEKQQGSYSLKVEAPDESTFTLTRTVSLDLSAYTGPVTASDDDKQRIWIFCNKFKRLNAVTIEVDVNGGTFATDYYTATISHKKLKAAGKGWFRFEVRKRQPVDPDTGQPITDKRDLPFFTRVGATNAKDWSTVAAVRIKLDVRAACTVRFDHWEVFGSLNGTIEGEDIQYYTTYVNDQGHESNSSPASAKKAFNRTGASLTSLTASADAQVTGKHIYRTGGTLGAVYRVTSTPVANATTTYTDTSTDDDLRRLGIQMETDNDAPPAAQVLIGPYFGRLIAAQTAGNKNRFFWTKQNKPYSFPGAALSAGNWADIGDTNEKIVAATLRTQMIRFYKENTIWYLIGDPDDVSGNVELSGAKIGLIGKNAVCAGPGFIDYFQGLEGIYEFNGTSTRKISQKLDPIFKGQTVTLASGVTAPTISSSNRDKSALEYVNGRLYYSYAETGQSTPNVTLVYDADTGNWTKDSRGFGVINYEGQNGSLLAGTADGKVLVLESGNDDAGSSFTVTYQSKYFDDGAPDTEKTFEDLTLEIDTGGQTLTVVAYTNNGTSNAIGTVNTSGRTRVVLQMNSGTGIQARNVSIQISGAISSPVVVYAATLNFYFEARQAKSFDSDESDLGTHKMKFVREAMLDLENSATVTLTLRTDQPGEAMATRQAPTIAAGTTRRMAHVVFNADYLGYLIRVLLSATSFRLYGLRLLIQIIGTYLLGGNNEFWLSDSIDFGTERVKLIREIEVVYSTTGTASLRVESDLPFGTSGQVIGSPYTLTATTGEETRSIPMSGTVKGRLFKFKITPTADFRLEAVRVYIKTIGAPNASGWTRVSLPVEPTQDAQWIAIPVPIDELG